jgi:hypothetical protein
MNPRGFRYGPYRVWVDLRRSRYFAVDSQPDLSAFIRGVSVRQAPRSFQGNAAVRPLAKVTTNAYARALPNEPRSRLLPEKAGYADDAALRAT